MHASGLLSGSLEGLGSGAGTWHSAGERPGGSFHEINPQKTRRTQTAIQPDPGPSGVAGEAPKPASKGCSGTIPEAQSAVDFFTFCGSVESSELPLKSQYCY